LGDGGIYSGYVNATGYVLCRQGALAFSL